MMSKDDMLSIDKHIMDAQQEKITKLECAAEQFFKSITDENGKPVAGVRYTEYRLAACFDEGADGYKVLNLLSQQLITLRDAAKLIQKILKGHKVKI